MRREFLKSEFHNSEVEKPVEFEMSDYDKALKNSIYPQNKPEIPHTTPSPDPGEAPVEPKIKQEPTETSTTPDKPEESQPTTQKVPAAVRRLQSNLDGKAWECTETHRPRLRVKTTGIEEEAEYMGSWNNTVPAKEETQQQQD